MSVVIISSESYCGREEIAGKVARHLGYKCLIGREVLSEASRRYEVPEAKLKEAMETLSSFRDSFSTARTRRLAYIQATFLNMLGQDKVVYHGWEGHLFVEGVSHILKVRLMADLEERARRKAEEENIPEKKARELLRKESEFTQNYSRLVFGLEETNAAAFDLEIDISRIGLDRSVSIIADTAGDVRFQPVTYSIKCLNDRELASRVRAALVGSYPDIRVQVRDGSVSLDSNAFEKKKDDQIRAVKEEIEGMEGVDHVVIGPG